MRRMGIRQVRCQSGLMGWRTRLHENYSDSFETFTAYDRIYNLAARLGFVNAEEAWDYNPVIEGSVNPSDFRTVRA